MFWKSAVKLKNRDSEETEDSNAEEHVQEHPTDCSWAATLENRNTLYRETTMIMWLVEYCFVVFYPFRRTKLNMSHWFRMAQGEEIHFCDIYKTRKRNQVLSTDQQLASVWAWPYLPGQTPPCPWDWGWSGRPGSRPACWHQCRCSVAVFSSTLAARDCYLCVSVVSLIVTNSSFMKQLYMHLNTYDWKWIEQDLYSPNNSDPTINHSKKIIFL